MSSNITEIIILIGLQASGKSTFYRTHFASTHELVSKDLLKTSKAKNKEQRQLERVEAALQEQRPVVVDNRLYAVRIPPESMQDTASDPAPRFIVRPMPKNA